MNEIFIWSLIGLTALSLIFLFIVAIMSLKTIQSYNHKSQSNPKPIILPKNDINHAGVFQANDDGDSEFSFKDLDQDEVAIFIQNAEEGELETNFKAIGIVKAQSSSGMDEHINDLKRISDNNVDD